MYKCENISISSKKVKKNSKSQILFLCPKPALYYYNSILELTNINYYIIYNNNSVEISKIFDYFVNYGNGILFLSYDFYNNYNNKISDPEIIIFDKIEELIDRNIVFYNNYRKIKKY